MTTSYYLHPSKQTGTFAALSFNNQYAYERTNYRHSPPKGNFARPFAAPDNQPLREPASPRKAFTFGRFSPVPVLRVFYSTVHHLLNTSSTGCYLLSTFPLELFGQFIARSTNFRQFMISFGLASFLLITPSTPILASNFFFPFFLLFEEVTFQILCLCSVFNSYHVCGFCYLFFFLLPPRYALSLSLRFRQDISPFV